MKLVAKVPIAIAALIAVVVAVVGIVAVYFAQSALQKSTEDRLLALVDARESALHDYLMAIQEDLQLTAQTGTTVLAMSGLPSNYESLGAEAARKLYVDDNPDPSDLGALDNANDGSYYS